MRSIDSDGPLPARWILGAVAAGWLGCARAPEPPPLPDLGALFSVDAATRAELDAALRTLEQRRGDVGAWVALAEALDRHELDAAALTVWQGAAALEPKRVEWSYRAGAAAVRARELDRARALLQATVQAEPTHRGGWRRLGELDLAEGDAVGARRCFERVQALAPTAADGDLGLAEAALLAEDAEAALRHASAALQRRPDDAFLRHVYGSALRLAGRADEALAHLAAGVGASPTWSDEAPSTEAATRAQGESERELVERADALAAEARLAEAADLYRRVVALRPTDVKVRTRLAIVLAHDGKLAEGLALIDEALAASPRRYDLLLAKVDVLRMGQRDAEALVAACDAIDAWPQRAQAWFVRGVMHRERGDLDSALTDFRAGLAAEPGDLSGAALVADVLMRRGEFDAAATLLEVPLLDREQRPPLDYFRLVLKAQAGAARPSVVLHETLQRARAIHGSAAESLVQSEGPGQ